MEDCLFCKIANNTIPAEVIYRDDDVLAFNDIRPQAPTHVLIIPKCHISTVNALTAEDSAIIAKIILTAQKIAQDADFAEAGYRLVWNCNRHGGQEVYHIHLHLLAGRQMMWPPG